MPHQKIHTEEFEIRGDVLVAKIKELLHAGNIRRITIKTTDGKTLIEIPLTVGIVVGIVAPVLAAVGAIAALVTRCVLVIEKVEDADESGH